MTDSRTLPPRRENAVEREAREIELFFFREEVKVGIEGRDVPNLTNDADQHLGKQGD